MAYRVGGIYNRVSVNIIVDLFCHIVFICRNQVQFNLQRENRIFANLY